MNYNKIILGGRLGADPELRTLNDGKCVVSFNLAVNRKFTKDHPQADWFTCEAWNGLAQTIEKYFKKGSQILVSGRIENDTYEKEGQKITRAKIKIEDFSFVDKANGTPQTSNGNHQPTTPPSEDDDMSF